MYRRVYDPRIGRFVSPDPVIPNPAFSQSYNRYAYPLRQTSCRVGFLAADPVRRNTICLNAVIRQSSKNKP